MNDASPPAQQSSADTTPTVFDALGGETGIRSLVDAFYDRMEAEPAFALLRSLHPDDMRGSRDKLYWFLCGWTGGPPLFVQRFGHPRLRARHLPFSIGAAERDQWLLCMAQALRSRELPPLLQHRLMGAFAETADFMRNRAEA